MVLRSKMAAHLVEVVRHFRLCLPRAGGACPSVCYTTRCVHTGGTGGACAHIRTRGSQQGRDEHKRSRRQAAVSPSGSALSDQLRRSTRLLHKSSVAAPPASQPAMCHQGFLDPQIHGRVDMSAGLNAISFSRTERRSILGCGGLTGTGSLLGHAPCHTHQSVRMSSNGSGGRSHNHNGGGHHGNGKKRKHFVPPSKKRSKNLLKQEAKMLLDDFEKSFKSFPWTSGNVKNNTVGKTAPTVQGFFPGKDAAESSKRGLQQEDNYFFGELKVMRGDWAKDDIERRPWANDSYDSGDIGNYNALAKDKRQEASSYQSKEKPGFVMKNKHQDILGPVLKDGRNTASSSLGFRSPNVQQTPDGALPSHDLGGNHVIKSTQGQEMGGHTVKDKGQPKQPKGQTVQHQDQTSGLDPVEELVMKVANTTEKLTDEVLKRLQPYIGTDDPRDGPSIIKPPSSKKQVVLELKPSLKTKANRIHLESKLDLKKAKENHESRARDGPRLTVSKNEIASRKNEAATTGKHFPFGHPAFISRNSEPSKTKTTATPTTTQMASSQPTTTSTTTTTTKTTPSAPPPSETKTSTPIQTATSITTTPSPPAPSASTTDADLLFKYEDCPPLHDVYQGSNSPFVSAGSKIREAIEHDNRGARRKPMDIDNLSGDIQAGKNGKKSDKQVEESDGWSDRVGKKKEVEHQYVHLHTLIEQQRQVKKADKVKGNDADRLKVKDTDLKVEDPQLFDTSDPFVFKVSHQDMFKVSDFDQSTTNKADKFRTQNEGRVPGADSVEQALKRQGRSVSSTVPWVSADLSVRDRDLIHQFGGRQSRVVDAPHTNPNPEPLPKPNFPGVWGMDQRAWRALVGTGDTNNNINGMQITSQSFSDNNVDVRKDNTGKDETDKAKEMKSSHSGAQEICSSSRQILDHMFFDKRADRYAFDAGKSKTTKPPVETADEIMYGSNTKKTENHPVKPFVSTIANDINNITPNIAPPINDDDYMAMLLPSNECFNECDMYLSDACLWPTFADDACSGKSTEKTKPMKKTLNRNLYEFVDMDQANKDARKQKSERNPLGEVRPPDDKTPAEEKSSSEAAGTPRKVYPRYEVDQAPFPFLRPKGSDVIAVPTGDVMADIRACLKGDDLKRVQRRDELEHRYTRLIQRRQEELVNLIGKLRDLRARSPHKPEI